MKLRRGDVAIVLFPESNLDKVNRRPALVVQADDLETGLNNVIVAQITSKLERADYPCRILITTNNRMAFGSGLKQDSVIMVDKLMAIETSLIEKTIGRILIMSPVDDALRITLAL